MKKPRPLYFAACPLVDESGDLGLDGSYCSACQTEIADIRGCTADTVRAKFARHGEITCVKADRQQFNASGWLRFAAMVAVGVPLSIATTRANAQSPPQGPPVPDSTVR